MKKLIIFIVTLIFTAGAAQSQDQPLTIGYAPSSYYTFSWNTSFTVGDFNKWVGNGSPAGFDFGGRYMIRKGLTAGFNFGWQRISQSYGYQTFYGDDGAAITSTNYRFTWMVPFQAVIGYHLMSDKMISPYLSLGIGGDYMEHHLLVQEYDIYKTRWGALVAVNYKWTTNQIVIANNHDLKNISMVNLKVGLVLIVR
jgi:hypothetical protein